MSSKWIRSAGAIAVLSAVSLMAAACGSSSGESPPASTGTGTSGATTPGVKAAAEFLAENLDNPTSIGLTTPLENKPADGKSVVYLKTPGAVAERIDSAQGAAAEAAGWSYSTVDTGATPATAVAAFDAAIAKDPDAIIFAGYPAAVFTKQIRQAKSEGIAVISNATADGPTDGVLADLGGLAQQELYGRLTAAYFVVNSGGSGRAAIFNLNIFPVLTAFGTSFQAAVEEWCPDCSTESVNQQLADVGTKTPANVVAYLQSNPDTTWAIFGNGDLSQGVSAAVKTARMDGINIIGEVPTQANLAHLESGEEKAWSGYPVDILGWRTIDALARHFEGSDVSESVAVPLPLQLITPDNVDEIVTDDGYYTAVDGYEEQFTDLWNLG